MKKSKILLILISVFLTAAVFNSCKKDDDSTPAPTNNNTAGDTLFNAKVDGVAWSSDTQALTNSPVTTLGVIGIESTTLTRITIIYSGPFTTGTVANGATCTFEYRDAVGTVYGSISGSVTFTKFDTANRVVSGSFTCNVKNNVANVTKVITNGVFSNLEY